MSAKSSRRKRAHRLASEPNFARRRTVLIGFLGVFLVAVVWSAFERQVFDNEFLQSQGERRYLRVREIPARRGMILDRNGEPLAVSTPVATVWANPSKLHSRPNILTALAEALGLDRTEVLRRFGERRGRAFMYIKRRIGPDEALAVERIVATYKLTELGIDTEYRRFYPSGEVFSHIIGFTNVDDHGIEGLELAFESWLHAEPGKRRVIQDGRQRVVAEVERIRPPRHGHDLTLSLDRRLQFLAYRELKRAVLDHHARAGSAVVLDVATGEILAMVNQPAYNPNGNITKKADARRDRAVTDVIEPGSTVKPFVVAAALEHRLVNPTTPINTSPGFLKVGRHLVRDVHNYGLLDTTGVITKSSNVGISKIALSMDRAVLWRLYDRLGFGHPTDIRFPGEVSGHLPRFEGWSKFENATLAFGYGLSVTPLQLAQAYCVLAADGVRRPVTLLKRDRSPAEVRVISRAAAREVRAMMETVVSAKGTARLAEIAGYRVAGKTGTAKKAVAGGYAAKRYQAVFAGMVPASAPRFVMVVVVDEPKGRNYYGGKVAAPVFARVMEAALRLYNVPPDDPQGTLLLAGAEARE
ncbi:MAG: penicillin-binding transpeptidase domain-containing protein [Chromatiaceae bacterium]